MLDHVGAVALILAGYMVGISNREVRASRLLFWSFFAVVSAHHAVSVFNYLVFTLPGAEHDAHTFHWHAANAAMVGRAPELSIGTEMYEHLLYLVYRVFGSNKLVGQSVSVLVSAVGLVLVLGVARQFGIKNERYKAALILVAGLTPSFLYFVSLTFREPFEVLGLIGGVVYALDAANTRSVAKLGISSGSLIFMGLFHHILFGMSFVLIAIGIAYFLYKGGYSGLRLTVGVGASAVVVLMLGYAAVIYVPATEGNDYIRILRESGGVVEMIDRYRTAVERNLPRSTYGYQVDTSSVPALMYGIAKSYASYLFGPASIRSALDVVPMINSIGRIAAFALVAFLLIRRRARGVGGLSYILAVYLLITLMWSLGITNYGQAFRHHSMTDWMLAVVLVLACHRLVHGKLQVNEVKR